MQPGKEFIANTKGRADETHTHGKRYRVLREGGLAPSLDGRLLKSFVCEDIETGDEHGFVEDDFGKALKEAK